MCIIIEKVAGVLVRPNPITLIDFEISDWGVVRSLGYTTFSGANLVITRGKIQFGEESAALNRVKEILRVR